MSQTHYETTLVIDSLQKIDDMQNAVKKIEHFIKNNGGTITSIDEWGKKRLAYEINRKQYGTYFHILFAGPATLPALLEGEYRLQESILRYLTVKSDKRWLKKLQKDAEPIPDEIEAEPAEPAEPAELAEPGLADDTDSKEIPETAEVSEDNSEVLAANDDAEEAKVESDDVGEDKKELS